MASDSEARGAAALPALFWFAVGLSTLTASYAVLTARGLAYDGSSYLLAIAGDRSFHFVEPARVSVQLLQQLPVVLAARIGIQNLCTLARLFTLVMDVWPLAFTALCWFVLTGREKIWIVGPLINLVFAIPAANFIGISEGTIASRRLPPSCAGSASRWGSCLTALRSRRARCGAQSCGRMMTIAWPWRSR